MKDNARQHQNGKGIGIQKRLQVLGDEILTAHRIVKDGNRITGFDEHGAVLFRFDGIKNESDFEMLDGGQYDAPESDGTEPSEGLEEVKRVSSAIIGGETENGEYVAQQFNRAVLMFAQTLSDDDALEIADVYPKWETGKAYRVDEIVRYGVNADNESQLYRVAQAHTTQDDWAPDITPALFTPIGFTDEGHSIWAQPLGAHDAYQTGDIVSHNGALWICTVNGNTWEPGVYGWERFTD